MTAIHIGTSGWSYPAWKGHFYPADLASGSMLSFYADRFNSVEVNNTFYRLPRREVLKAWTEQVPPGFSFVIKASRRITHNAKLGAKAADPLAYLLDACSELGDQLGPVLFQTPPWLKKDVPLLKNFLALLPSGVWGAFEFRSTSWFDEEVYDALRERNAALVVADTGEAEKAPPLVRTANWGYVRLRRVSYSGALLGEWATRLARLGWDRLWVFFKHEDEGTGPRLAAQFQQLMASPSSRGNRV